MTQKPVHHIILSNGDHIMATIGKSSRSNVILEEPFLIDEHRDDETGQTSMILNQYLYTRENLKINKSHIMVSIPVDETVEKYYRTYVTFNREIVEKNKYHDMNKVTSLLEQTIEAERKVKEPTLVVFKDVIDSRQLYVPSSNNVH